MEFEGLATEPYQDVGGVWTWGYGHAQKKGEPIPKHITEEEAVRILCEDMEIAEADVERWVDVPLTQGQFDALCDFCFNLGGPALARSSLLKKLNAGAYEDAKLELTKWSFVGQKYVAGLLRRRLAEQLLWES
jgi:lysozyme